MIVQRPQLLSVFIPSAEVIRSQSGPVCNYGEREHGVIRSLNVYTLKFRFPEVEPVKVRGRVGRRLVAGIKEVAERGGREINTVSTNLHVGFCH